MESRKLDRLEVARGLAALLIVLYHATAIVQTPKYHGRVPCFGVFSAGDFGVDFFFVLSGFILLHVHRGDAGRPGRLGRYAAKRFVRIYPPYWAATLLVLPVYAVAPGFGTGTELDASRLWTSWFLLPHGEAPVVPVAWSLRHEVLFYAVLGWILAQPRLGLAAFASWQGAIVIANLRGPLPPHPAAALALDIRNLDFALGMAAAWCMGRLGGRPSTIAGTLEPPAAGALGGAWACSGRARVFVVFGTLGLAWCTASALGWAPSMPWTWSRLGYGIASASLIVGLALVDRRAARRPPRILVLLGEASYSIYLTHYALLSACAKVLAVTGVSRALSAEAFFVLLSVLATLGGIAFYRAIERPLLTYCRRTLDGRRPAC